MHNKYWTSGETGGMHLHRMQEVNKQWSKSPFIADNVGALSPEVRDLLDKIFVVDPEARITIQDIMKHPW